MKLNLPGNSAYISLNFNKKKKKIKRKQVLMHLENSENGFQKLLKRQIGQFVSHEIAQFTLVI